MADTLKTMPVASLSDVTPDSADKFILYRDDDKGAYVVKYEELIDAMAKNLSENDAFWEMANAMGSHNALYRGRNLGSAVTDAQWAAIKAGTFEDLFIGDYWEINGVIWRIAAFDYYINTGSNYYCEDHHIVVVPDTSLYDAQMNDSGTTTGGYSGSQMYTTNLNTAKTTVNNAFGSAHILTHENYFTNAVTSGYPSGGAWADCTLEIMNEEMVYGTIIKQQASYGGASSVYNNTTSKSQLPLFQFRHDLIGIKVAWWLRDIITATSFCIVDSAGASGNHTASNTHGVRPAFCIYQS